MSQWTHIAGLIRLDNIGMAVIRGGVPNKKDLVEDAIKKALGNTCDYDSTSTEWDECSVPCGSEGSLQYRSFPNRENMDNDVCWGYIAIWGDLRDFGSEKVQELVGWFKGSLDKLRKPESKPVENMSQYYKAVLMLSTFSIRDAVLSIDVEGAPRTILSWNDDLLSQQQIN